MDWLKPPLRKVRNRLSHSRPQSPNPSIDERDQDQSRSRPPASLESHLDTKSSPSAHAFTRSKNLQQDIGALYVAYVLQGSAGLRDLIHEVDRISLNERFKDALEPSVSIAADFVAALDSKPVPDGVNAAISKFLVDLKKIDSAKSSPNEAIRIVEQSVSQLKSAHPHIFTLRNTYSSHFKAIAGSVLGVALPMVNILKEASSIIPVPMLQPLIGVVAGFLKAADESSNNCEWMRWLAATAAEYILRIVVICPENTDSQWGQAIDNFTPRLLRIVDEAAQFSQRSVTSRIFRSGSDKGKIEFIKEDLTAALNLFYLDIGRKVTIKLDSMARNIEGLYLESLPRLPEYSSSHDRYFPGSRQEEIQQTLEWIEGDGRDPILWIHGGVGVGKSTYARQLLDHIKQEGMLGAFAYFAAGMDSHPKDVVRMMARELASLQPACRPEVARAIQECAGVHHDLDKYITHFLVEPILALSYSGPLVIVLDALDEWTYSDEFLVTLINKVDLAKTDGLLKFVVTSRYSKRIDSIISSRALLRNLTPVSPTVCRNYFKGRFDAIDWDDHYPESQILERLVELADGLLIWAATVCTLVTETNPHDEPRDILDSILTSSSKVARGDGMKALYKLAMERIFPNDNEESKQSRYNILLTMSALKEALPLEEFSRLAGPIRTKFVKETLIGMRAIQTRGTYDELMVRPAIQLFHASFIDYIGTLEDAHADMTRHCISFLGQSQDTSPSLSEKLFRPAELYIGKHFVYHLCEALPDIKSKAIQELESSHIRKWVAWSLAQLMITGEENGFPAGSRSLMTLSESLLHEHGVIYSPELMSRDTILISGIVAGFSSMLEFAGVFRGGKLITDREDDVRYKHDVNNWIHVINGVVIGRLQLQRMKYPSLFSSHIHTEQLEKAIKLLNGVCAVISSCPLSIMENHALALELGFEYGGVLNDLEGALTLHRNIQAHLSEKTPGYTTFLNNYAHALHTHFQYDVVFSIDVLHTSISLHQQALAHDPNDHHKRATFLSDLGAALHTKYLAEDPKNPSVAIGEITNYHQQAITLRSKHPTHMPLLFNNLSSALQSRFQLRESENPTEDLVQALFYSLRAVSAGHLLMGCLEHSTYITTLGYALRLVSHTQPRIPLHHLVTPERLTQFAAIANRKWESNTTKLISFDCFSPEYPDIRRYDAIDIARDAFTVFVFFTSKMMTSRLEELSILAQRAEGVVVPKGLENLLALPKLTEPRRTSPDGLPMLHELVESGRMAELAWLAEPAWQVELVGLVELQFLGELARNAGRAAVATSLTQLRRLAEQARYMEQARLAEELAECQTGHADQVEQNKELAKRIKELLYNIELDALCWQLALQALLGSTPGAPSRSAIILLRGNIEDEGSVRGGAFLRLRARPLAALAEIDRQSLMKASKAFSELQFSDSDTDVEGQSDIWSSSSSSFDSDSDDLDLWD